MSKTTYTHITTEGEVATRKSAKAYTHVAVMGGSVWSWHGSQELAQKAVNKYRGWGHSGRVEAVNNGEAA